MVVDRAACVARDEALYEHTRWPVAHHTAWPDVLDDGFAIARHVEQQSSDYVDFDLVVDNFFGMRAVLRMVPINEIGGSVQDHHIRVIDKERAYAELPASTRPPLLVHTNGDVADGRHRWRDAIKRGETEILCYVAEDETAHASRQRSELDLLKYGDR